MVLAEYINSKVLYLLIIFFAKLIFQKLGYVFIPISFVIRAKFLQGSTPILKILLKFFKKIPSLLPISRIDTGANFFFM